MQPKPNPYLVPGGALILGSNLLHFVVTGVIVDVVQLVGCLAGGGLVLFGWWKSRQP